MKCAIDCGCEGRDPGHARYTLIERIEAAANAPGPLVTRSWTPDEWRLIATALRAARRYFADLYVMEEPTGVVDELRSALAPIFGEKP